MSVAVANIAAPPPPPAEQRGRRDFEAASFRGGVGRSDWRLVSFAWPVALVGVSAAPRTNGPAEFFLRIDLTDYPTLAPTATPWDVETDQMLASEKRPKGERVAMAFRADWENGRALYVPYDRVALAGHPGWVTQYPRDVWTEQRDITFFVNRVHELLNDEDYQGV
ncbi:MAG: hypothetical protein ACLGI5_16375 [Thermoleophilia bacterium]